MVFKMEIKIAIYFLIKYQNQRKTVMIYLKLKEFHGW